MSQPQIIDIPEIFKEFSRLQTCLRSNSSKTRKNSKTFLACRIVSAENHQYPGNTERFFCLQNCLSRKSPKSRKNSKTFYPAVLSQGKSSVSRKYPKTFSPADMSYQQIINVRELFKDFSACRIVLAANYQYRGNTQNPSRLLNCFSSKSLIPRKYSKIFLACKIVLAANHHYPENTQRLFRLHNCLSRKSSISPKYSKTFSPAELSQQQIIKIPEIFKDFSRLQNCLSSKSLISRKYSKSFLACRIVLAAIHQKPGKIQRLFSPAELSQPKIINIREILKDFFCLQNCLSRKSPKSRKNSKLFTLQNCLRANHRYPVNIQRRFRLQICRISKSSTSGNCSKIFPPAELSQPPIINIAEILKILLAC